MRLVLDVSAAFLVLTGAKGKEPFLPLLDSAELVLAPDLFRAEAANTAWKYHRLAGLSPEEASVFASQAIQLVDQFMDSDALWAQAFELSCQLKHPVYDTLYLILAQREEAALLSADLRLLTVAEDLGIQVQGPLP